MRTVQERTLREGFSLIEIMIGLVIIALIMGLAGTTAINQLKKAKMRTTKLSLMSVKKALDEYYVDTNQYPEKLMQLVKKPAEIKGWEGPYWPKDEAPTDAWGEQFKYTRSASGGKKPYELSSYGPNRRGAPKEEWISVWDI